MRDCSTRPWTLVVPHHALQRHWNPLQSLGRPTILRAPLVWSRRLCTPLPSLHHPPPHCRGTILTHRARTLPSMPRAQQVFGSTPQLRSSDQSVRFTAISGKRVILWAEGSDSVATFWFTPVRGPFHVYDFVRLTSVCNYRRSIAIPFALRCQRYRVTDQRDTSDGTCCAWAARDRHEKVAFTVLVRRKYKAGIVSLDRVGRVRLSTPPRVAH